MVDDTSDRLIRALLEDEARLRRFARDLVSDETIVDDVLQDTALAAMTAPPRRARDPRLWVLSVTRNLARKVLRGEKNRREREHGKARDDAAARDPRPPHEEEALVRLVEAVSALPEIYQEIVLMRYFLSLRPSAIATELKIPLATVKVRLKRALARLRSALDGLEDRGRPWRPTLVGLAVRMPRRAAASLQGLPVGLAALLVLVVGVVIIFWPSAPGGPAERVAPRRSPAAGKSPAQAAAAPAGQGSPSVGAAPATVREEAPWTVTGVIAYAASAGVPGPGIELHSCGRFGSAISAEDGSFTLVMRPIGSLKEGTKVGIREGQARVLVDGHTVLITGRLPVLPAPGSADAAPTWSPVLPAPVLVTGRVVDPAGRPIEGARLAALNRRSGMTIKTGMAFSGRDGTIALSAPLEGTCTVRLYPRLAKPRGAGQQGAAEQGPADGTHALWPMTPDMRVEAHPPSSIDLGTLHMGRISRLLFEVVDDASGAPVAGATVTVRRCPVRGIPLRSPPTNERGLTSVAHVPGKRRISVVLDDYQPVDLFDVSPGRSVDLRPAETTRMTIRVVSMDSDLARDRGFSGWRLSIVDRYAYPIAGATIRWGQELAETDAMGQVTFAHRPRGPLEITQRAFEPCVIRAYEPDFRGRMTVRLRSRRRRVLEIRDHLDRPVRSLTAFAFHEARDQGRLTLTGKVFSLRDANGRHEIADAPLGDPPGRARPESLSLFLYARGLGFGRADVRRNDVRTSPACVHLRPLERIRGRLVDEHDEPVGGAVVYSGVKDLPLMIGVLARQDEVRVEEQGKLFEGSWYLGVARSRPDGGFALPGASRDGMLVILAGKDRGRLVEYRRASDISTIVVRQGPSVTFARRTRPPPDDMVFLSVLRPNISFAMVFGWPAEKLRFRKRLPLWTEWFWQVGSDSEGVTAATGVVTPVENDQVVLVDR